MSQLPKRYCVFGCDPLVTFRTPLHRFPNPEKHPDLFAKWVSIIGDQLKETDRKKIYSNKRVCDHHFDPVHKMSDSHLKPATVPSINLHRVQQSSTTFVEMDHGYSCRIRESFSRAPMMDIANMPGPTKFAVEPIAEIPTPSASTAMTCPVTPAIEKAQARKPHTKFDADKTFDFICKNPKTACARKLRESQNEIRRLRLKLKSYEMRLRQLEKISVQRNLT